MTRQMNGYSQEELAEKIHKSQPLVSRTENNIEEDPEVLLSMGEEMGSDLIIRYAQGLILEMAMRRRNPRGGNHEDQKKMNFNLSRF